MTANSPRRIVVGVDGSEESKQALRWAAHLAVTYGARVEPVTAFNVPTTYGYAPMDASAWDPAPDAQKMLDSTIAEVLGDDPGVEVITSVAKGGAAAVLLQAAEGATMLVVGSRGHGGFTGMLLGSVSANVAEHASCPVLIAHGDDPLPDAV